MSLSPDDSSARLICQSAGALPGEFSRAERLFLLQLAHESIECELQNRELSLVSPSPHLAERRGAFTTLYCGGELRGCVGYVLPAKALFRTVAETARAAAFEDSRFWPVTPGELSQLEISLSILSPVQPIQPEEVEVGRHGLLITRGGHRGLLLPQVPVEHRWDRVSFLEQTCHKAGLPANAWHEGAKLEAFTAEVFGDRDLGFQAGA